MSQQRQVLEHLKRYGVIDPMTALQKYGIFRLAARVNDLRGKGYGIETEIVRRKGKAFAKYRYHRNAS